jgi:hypothetical protein
MRDAVNKFGRYLKDVGAASGVGRQDHRAKEIGNALFNAVPNMVGKVGADLAVPAARKMVKDTTPGVANLWTGKRESGAAVGAAFVAAAGYGTYSGMKQTTLAPRTGEVSYGGTAPVMNADGVSSTPQAPLSGAPTLGANGQMVFGLHNARKG